MAMSGDFTSSSLIPNFNALGAGTPGVVNYNFDFQQTNQMVPAPAWNYPSQYYNLLIHRQLSNSQPTTSAVQQETQETNLTTKRTRTAYTSQQLFELEREFNRREFNRDKCLTRSLRIHLAGRLKLSKQQVKVCFQKKGWENVYNPRNL
ncbi:homeobox protein Hox-B3-like [Zophobas morio]|uniref:homeobox protein Hox-B3-like n=1 Tax=Zophobas morio TaxID=2755281 RepID=UPI00308351F0